ncbi:MAG: hypothetical protein ACJ73D_04815 [Pyrinomonadaceae bacterium]
MTKNTVGLLLSLSVLGFVALGCSKTPPPAAYVGAWTGADGTTMTLRSDGSGDYKSANASIDGGSVTIDEAAKSLKIAFAGMGPSFTIDKSPSGGQMTLSGVVYKSGSGSSSSSTTSSSDTSSSDPSSIDGPSTISQSDAAAVMSKTISAFAQGVKDGDMQNFYDDACKVYRDQSSKEETQSTFKSFEEKKDIVVPILKSAVESAPSFVSGPTVDTQNGYRRFSATGTYPAGRYKVQFTMEFYWTEGRWGWKRFKIDM